MWKKFVVVEREENIFRPFRALEEGVWFYSPGEAWVI